ncbi:unnamed protein product [Hymenolepis diminuta]|uniref:HTH_48 domain-containing protein n=1 Tax=Hymenolepis diminuta TaxID=6216 RepID=A0A0R3S7K3_HYMDI|nr:unnamed protein product [Hymenolepis diminuta]
MYVDVVTEVTGSTAKALKDTYGNGVVNEKAYRRWFSPLKKDDFSLKDERRIEGRMLKQTQVLAIASCYW